MPRRVRNILPKIPHHTIQRGNNRQKIFFEDEDYQWFLKKLNEQSLKNEVRIGAYCLMTNHIHLLVYPLTPEGMIRCMKMVGQCYTQYVNKKYKRTGKLWENRYKTHWIDPDREWFLARYIEKNPVRAGMVTRAEAYPYSSAQAHLLGRPDLLLSNQIFIEDKRQAYRDFFEEDADKEEKIADEITGTLEQCKAYGSENFIKSLEQLLGINVRYFRRGRPAKAEK